MAFCNDFDIEQVVPLSCIFRSSPETMHIKVMVKRKFREEVGCSTTELIPINRKIFSETIANIKQKPEKDTE